MTITRISSGVYVNDSLCGKSHDRKLWQTWRWRFDRGICTELTEEGLHIHGRSTEDRRAFSGLVSRRLYPADAVLMCDLKVLCDMEQVGVYAAVVHLCNRLVGDEVKTLEVPDNNGEIALGRFEEHVGWFQWYYDQSNGVFQKWKKGTRPSLVAGIESNSYTTVRISYSQPDKKLTTDILDGGSWVKLGEDVTITKVFSSIELKADVQAKDIDVDFFFRNCLLFPYPARSPVGVFVGRYSDNAPLPLRGVSVELVDFQDYVVLSSGITDDEGLTYLQMGIDWVYPISGKFVVRCAGGQLITETFPSNSVDGVFPGDFFVISVTEDQNR